MYKKKAKFYSAALSSSVSCVGSRSSLMSSYCDNNRFTRKSVCSEKSKFFKVSVKKLPKLKSIKKKFKV
jgi:hypothetical protein